MFRIAWILALLPLGFNLAHFTAALGQPPVTALAIAPDDETLVGASQAGLRLFSLPGLKLKGELATKLENPHDLQFSPSGKQLAIAGGAPAVEGSIEIWDWPARGSSRTLVGHEDTVTSLQWLSDTELASASLDQKIVVWNTRSGEPTHTFQGHSRGINALAILPDERILLSGGVDQSLRVWDLASGQLIHSLVAHTQAINQLATRPASSGLPMVASAGDDRTVRFWQPTIGRMVRFVRLPSTPLDICWQSDGRQIAAACTDGTIYRIDPETVTITKQHAVQTDNWLYALTLRRATGQLLAGGRGGQLFLIDNP